MYESRQCAMLGYKEEDKILCQEAYPVEVGGYRLLGRAVQGYKSTSKKRGVKMRRDQRRLPGAEETKAHFESRRGIGLTFQAGDRAHLDHFK